MKLSFIFKQKLQLHFIVLIIASLFISKEVFTQEMTFPGEKIPFLKNKFEEKAKERIRFNENKKKSVHERKSTGLNKTVTPLSKTPQIQLSEKEIMLSEQINQLKQNGTSPSAGEKILELQRELESINGSTITKNESSIIGNVIHPGPQTDNLSSNLIFNSEYIVAYASQVEQRGAGSGKIWLAVAHSGLDTGAGATPDTINMYYSTNGGDSFIEYVKVAFSPANKISFDDLDMEIIENTTGTKYIYLVFGYYTNGYFGRRLAGYVQITTPTLSVFGTTFSFPGQSTVSNIYFNARVTSDNARYAGIPYVTIAVMQDSTDGTDHFFMTKMCKILSPYALNPSITYFPKSIYSVAPGFIDYGVTIDLAYYHNGSDSLIFVLSAYPGYNDKIYFYKADANTTVNYPVQLGYISPSGYNVEYARIAANGGTNQTKLLLTYTENYQNSGDYDQWYLSSTDANFWIFGTLEYSSLHNSHYGDVIGKRNADGSFAVTFLNKLNNMHNVTSCTFSGDFNLDTYVHCVNTDYANSIASPKPSFRHVNGDSCLTFWSYFYTMYSTSGSSAINYYLTVVAEGYYDEVNNLSPINDYIQIVLAETNPPYNRVDTAGVYLDHLWLMNELAFKNAPDGSYYLVTKHRNALETWSANPVTLTKGYGNGHDFTSSDAQAYGNNMIFKTLRWCLYSGDVDQDDQIDGNDTQITDNDAASFVLGQYLNTDLNGDNFVDGADMVIVDNNAANFVSAVTP